MKISKSISKPVITQTTSLDSLIGMADVPVEVVKAPPKPKKGAKAKAPAKKAPAKKPVKPKRPSDGLVDIVRQTATNMSNMPKVVCESMPLMDATVDEVPVDHFFFQWGLGRRTLPMRVLFEIIGPEHVGKTTLVAYMFGQFAAQGGYAIYQETEGKLLPIDRWRRSVSSDPIAADRYLRNIMLQKPRRLDVARKALEQAAYRQRGMFRQTSNESQPTLSKSEPLFMATDVWGALKNKQEAELADIYKKDPTRRLTATQEKEEKKKKKPKTDIEDLSNLGHAQYAAHWMRLLPEFLDEVNGFMVWTHHQTEKIDMAAGGGKKVQYYSPEYLASRNKNHVGGRSSGQRASFQVTLTPSSFPYKNADGIVCGTMIRATFVKNSFGADSRVVEWALRTDSKNYDRDGYLAPSLDLDVGFASWLARCKYLGVKLDGKLYTCKDMGISGGSAQEIGRAFHADAGFADYLGGLLHIEGYARVSDAKPVAIPEGVPQTKKVAADEPPPDPVDEDETPADPDEETEKE